MNERPPKKAKIQTNKSNSNTYTTHSKLHTAY